MSRLAQAMALTLLGGMVIKLVLSDSYLRYVQSWTRWPLLVSGAVMVAVAVYVVWQDSTPESSPGRAAQADPGAEHLAPVGDDAADRHSVPWTSWLLLLPVAVVFLVSPPALGGYMADRRANEAVPNLDRDYARAPLRVGGGPADLLVSEFVYLAEFDGPASLRGQPVVLRGFVTEDRHGWYVTRIAINCCAADGSAYRVRVDGAPAPSREQWVRVQGTWKEPPASAPAPATPVLTAVTVERTRTPKQTYE